MKRVITIFSSFTLLICCIFISVSASGLSDFDNDSMVNLVDYYEFNQINFDPGSTELVHRFSLPDSSRVYYGFDIVFTNNAAVNAVYYIHPQHGAIQMNFIDIGNGLSRAFIDNYPWRSDYIDLLFVYGNTNPSYWIQINSFYVNFYNVDHFTSSCEASGFTPSGSVDLSLNYGDSRPTQVTWAASDFNNLSFSIDVTSPDWQKFDYLDFQIICTVKSITSVSATFGDIVLPFSVSQIGDDSSGRMTILISVRIDLRGLDRSTSYVPTLIITGNSNLDYLNAFKLADCSGYVQYNINPLFYYFKNLFIKLDSSFQSLANVISNAINPSDDGDAEQFQEVLIYQAGELDDIANVMESLDKPDPDSLNVNLDSFALNANISGVGSVLAVPMRNELLLQVLIMTFTFALVGYVLFGKR